MGVAPVPPGPSRIALGRWGEQLAAQYLVDRGMAILDHNWRCSIGEIDLVARDGVTIVICEVKTRAGVSFGDPVEAVSWQKYLRLRRLAAAWLEAHREPITAVRVDVIGIIRPQSGRPRVRHLVGVG